MLSLGRHSHPTEVKKLIAHEHQDFQEIHHEHQFHIGILHVLGHLFEQIVHQDNTQDQDIVIVTLSNFLKNVIQQGIANSAFFQIENGLVFSVDSESLPDPPFYLAFLQKFKRPDTPLRAPPALV